MYDFASELFIFRNDEHISPTGTLKKIIDSLEFDIFDHNILFFLRFLAKLNSADCFHQRYFL